MHPLHAGSFAIVDLHDPFPLSPRVCERQPHRSGANGASTRGHSGCIRRGQGRAEQLPHQHVVEVADSLINLPLGLGVVDGCRDVDVDDPSLAQSRESGFDVGGHVVHLDTNAAPKCLRAAVQVCRHP